MIEGLRVGFRNVPGSALTRVSIDDDDVFSFDPGLEQFVHVVAGRWVPLKPDLPANLIRTLRGALVQHSIDRELAFEKLHDEALRRQDPFG